MKEFWTEKKNDDNSFHGLSLKEDLDESPDDKSINDESLEFYSLDDKIKFSSESDNSIYEYFL